MQLTYNAHRMATLEQRCQVLECMAEAMVLAQCLEMAHDKEAYPCCVKCGDMAFVGVPGMPGSSGPPSGDPPMADAQISALLEARGIDNAQHDRDQLGGPGTLRVQSARQLASSKAGHALELAVFQCAADRLRDKDCKVAVDYDEAGNVHCYVQYADGAVKNPQDDTTSTEACGCGGTHG